MTLFSALPKIHCQLQNSLTHITCQLYETNSKLALCSLPFRETDKSLENKREMSVPKALHAHILLLISLE